MSYSSNTDLRKLKMQKVFFETKHKICLDRGDTELAETYLKNAKSFEKEINKLMQPPMKIIGLIKVRNEEAIIQETLDDWGAYCTGGIYVYDDNSTDKTVEICKNHEAVKYVHENKVWDPNREQHEWQARQHVLVRAQQDATKDDWFVYFDADERLYFDEWDLLFHQDLKGISCKLYDIYITPEDKDEPDHNKRNWVGPEYRTILFFFRNVPELRYWMPDQRIVTMAPNSRVIVSGVIKHYGKGLSVQHWEDTCDYYINFFPKYSAKWKERKGKAVKTDMKSDFGNNLIKFNDVLSGNAEGFSLEAQTYGQN